MSPRDFMTLAHVLQSGNAEAEWRTAISRAYYSAFHTARQLLRDWGFQLARTDQAHVGLTRRLAVTGVAEYEKVARELSELRAKRNAADYDLDRECRRELAAQSVKTTGVLLGLLAVEVSSQRQQQVIQAVRDFERNVLREVTWQSLN